MPTMGKASPSRHRGSSVGSSGSDAGARGSIGGGGAAVTVFFLFEEGWGFVTLPAPRSLRDGGLDGLSRMAGRGLAVILHPRSRGRTAPSLRPRVGSLSGNPWEPSERRTAVPAGRSCDRSPSATSPASVPAPRSPRTAALRPRTDVGRSGRPLGLSVLRGRLRPARLREGRARSSTSRAIPTRRSREGCLCPKGAATFQLVTGSHRVHRVLYRAPARHRVGDAPARAGHGHGGRARAATRARRPGRSGPTTASRCSRTLGIAHLGGATLDNEENYLIKKLFTALGIVQIENQARI